MPASSRPGVWPAGLVLLGLLVAGPSAAVSAREPAAGAPEARPAQSIPSPRVRAEAAIIFDPETGNAVWELNAREPRPIASITKVMTAMLFLDGGQDLDRDVVISRRDVQRASTTYLRRGERVSLRDLVHLALVASDNVAARVLARASRWGTKRFISRMNAMAAELGLEQTRFTDPSGLHEGNVSSAHDVSRLIAAAGRQPEIARIIRKRSHRIRTSRQNRVVRNTNRLLDTRSDVVGGKTGYINEAGYCLATLIRVGDRAVIGGGAGRPLERGPVPGDAPARGLAGEAGQAAARAFRLMSRGPLPTLPQPGVAGSRIRVQRGFLPRAVGEPRRRPPWKG